MEKKTEETAKSMTVEYHTQYKREKLREFRVYIPKGSELEAWITSQPISISNYFRLLAEGDLHKEKKRQKRKEEKTEKGEQQDGTIQD